MIQELTATRTERGPAHLTRSAPSSSEDITGCEVAFSDRRISGRHQPEEFLVLEWKCSFSGSSFQLFNWVDPPQSNGIHFVRAASDMLGVKCAAQTKFIRRDAKQDMNKIVSTTLFHKRAVKKKDSVWIIVLFLPR